MSVIRSFDLIARPYRTLEYLTLGRTLEHTRLYYLPHLLTARNALVLGDGDGRFLARLLAANPTVQATAIDLSAEMLRLLRERCAPYAGRLQTRQTNALDFTPPEGARYDLVVTHFFLDCLSQPEVEQLIRKIVPSLTSDALWIVSDFRIPAGLMRWPARLLVRSLYLAFRILTGLRTSHLPDHTSALQAAGFHRIEQTPFLFGVLTTEIWQRSHNPS